MKNKSKIIDPLNYQLIAEDLQNPSTYEPFLKDLTDIPAADPLHPVNISKAGIHNQSVYITIEDIENKKEFVPLLCNVSVSTNLTTTRGVHMSRFLQAIFSLSTKKFHSLDDFSSELAQTVRELQGSQIGVAEVTGTYLHKTLTKKTQQLSMDKLQLISNATVTEKDVKVKTGMEVYNLTACPCTRTFTKYSVVPELQKMGLTIEQINQILDMSLSGTHTQRGVTTLLLDKESADINHTSIYNILNNSVHMIYELLKRPDEHDLVLRALKKPQFTEDVAREVAFNTYQQFNDVVSSDAKLYAKSILFDSIHIHDVQTVVENTFGELKKELAGK
ncbi:MAG: GTP cyclohydrolase, FolE2/MptA family [Candidatus Levyibacteriota bacterium]